jgi:hypothetical protein
MARRFASPAGCLRGSGYTSNDEATAAGDQWRSLLSISFARLNFGADVDRASGGGYFNARLRWLSQRPGRRVLEDKPGLTTFECDPPPVIRASPIGRDQRASAVAGTIPHGCE